jgi:phosphatidate cytidylyltransferase
MSLELSDPLVFYTIATIAILVIASILFAVVHVPGGFLPIRTWLVILPIALGALWLGELVGSQLPWAMLVATVSVVGFREFARVTGLAREPLFCAVVIAAIVLQNVFALANRYDVFMALPMWAILGVAVVPIILNRTEHMLQDLALSIVGIVFYGYFLAHLTYLATSPLGLGYVLFVTLATQLNDGLGFVFGKTLGRHHWTPISPNKTVEGSLLAAITTVLLTFAQAPVAFPQVPPPGVLAAGLIIAIGGQVGDLTMANVKRNAGVKDFGTLLPGHGGLTDRLNSLMITAPAFAHFMGYLFGGFPA